MLAFFDVEPFKHIEKRFPRKGTKTTYSRRNGKTTENWKKVPEKGDENLVRHFGSKPPILIEKRFPRKGTKTIARYSQDFAMRILKKGSRERGRKLVMKKWLFWQPETIEKRFPRKGTKTYDRDRLLHTDGFLIEKRFPRKGTKTGESAVNRHYHLYWKKVPEKGDENRRKIFGSWQGDGGLKKGSRERGRKHGRFI